MTGRLSLLCIIACASGCRALGYSIDNPANPMAGVRKIAVMPVATPGTNDPLRLGEMLAGELVQFPGVDVVRPADLQAILRRQDVNPSDERGIRMLGRLAGADAVLVTELTEYSAYPPPRIGVAAQLFFTRAESSDARAVIDLSTAGRARPVANLDRCELLQVEKVYDGAQRETRDLAAVYARGHYTSKEAIDGADRVLRLPDLYFRFVSNRLVRDLFAAYRAHGAVARANPRG